MTCSHSRKLCATALCGLVLTAKPVVLQCTTQVLLCSLCVELRCLVSKIMDTWISVLMANDYGAERKPAKAPLEIKRRQALFDENDHAKVCA